MKPADHPDFFKRPPPPGRSRESSIVLDERGQFWHDGEKLQHAGMARAFASWISRHPGNGRYVLNNGFDWTYLSVKDTPFFVRTLRPTERGLVLELSDGSTELLDPSTLSIGDEDAVYVRVKGDFEAKFLPAAQHAMAPYLAQGPNGETLLEWGKEQYSFGVRPRIRKKPG